MTDLERIEIEGFKSLESISFEPSKINLITGRNNTGKTSLLEAINLVLNTSNLENFGPDIGKVINENYDVVKIVATDTQTSSTFRLRKPSQDEIHQFFIQEFLNLFHGEVNHLPLFPDDNMWTEDEKLNKLEAAIQTVFHEKAGNGEIEKLEKELVVVTVNDNTHPYFSGGEKSEEILALAVIELTKKFKGNSDDLSNGRIGTYTLSGDGSWITLGGDKQSVTLTLAPRGANRLGSELADKTDAKFIESAMLARSIEDEGQEKDAVKIDDIGDYIKEKGIIDDLKTFDIDSLVFEKEDGEKYQVPYDFMGDGFKAIVGLLWELLDENNKSDIILLEEPENHMHPGYIREVVYFLIELAQDEDVQLFITTHNSDFIDSFFTENLTDEEEEFLKEEFSLIRMEEDTAVVEDYETAKDDLENLHLDLRGI